MKINQKSGVGELGPQFGHFVSPQRSSSGSRRSTRRHRRRHRDDGIEAWCATGCACCSSRAATAMPHIVHFSRRPQIRGANTCRGCWPILRYRQDFPFWSQFDLAMIPQAPFRHHLRAGLLHESRPPPSTCAPIPTGMGSRIWSTISWASTFSKQQQTSDWGAARARRRAARLCRPPTCCIFTRCAVPARRAARPGEPQGIRPGLGFVSCRRGPRLISQAGRKSTFSSTEYEHRVPALGAARNATWAFAST